MAAHSFWRGVIVIGGLLGVAFLASPPPIPTAAAPPASPRAKPTYAPGDVNLERSRAYIFVGKTGLGHEHAVAGVVKAGAIAIGAKEHAGEVVFDMTKFAADPDYARRYIGLEGASDASTQRKVTDNMLGPDVLDAAQFPTATWTISAAQATGKLSPRGKPLYQFDGQFTLHGTTRPLRLWAEAERHDGWIHIVGKFSMQQTDYGIKPFSKAFGAIGVANQLTIYGDLWVAADGPDAAGAR
jgi:polyisoprenoid-binding protein YceI